MMERAVLFLTLLCYSLVTLLDGSRNPVVALMFSGLFTSLLAVRLVVPRRGGERAGSAMRYPVPVCFALVFWLLLTWLHAAEVGLDSVDPYRSHLALFLGVGYVSTWFLFLSLLTTPGRLGLFAGVITLVAVLQVLFGMLNYYGQDTVLGWAPTHYALHRVTGTYVNRNLFANLLVMSSGFALVWLLVRRPRTAAAEMMFRNGTFGDFTYLRATALFVLIMLMAGLVLSGSRGGMLSAMVATGFLLGLTWVIPGIRISFWPMICGFTGVGILFGFGLMKLRLSSLGADSLDRLEQWRSTLELVALRPWAGYGPGTYEVAFRNRKSGDLGPLTYDQAHNDYLQLLTEQGVLGLLPAVLILSVLLIGGLARAYGCSSVRRKRWLLASLFGIVAMMFHGFLESPFRVPANVWLFVALMAILSSAARISFGPDSEAVRTASGTGR